MKLIVLNGPPNCGKDTTADWFSDNLGWHKFKMAFSLKLGAHALLGDSLNIMKYEGPSKEEPQADLLGEVPREWYIYLAEEVLKPRFGHDVFGRIAVNRLRANPPEESCGGVVISDCGFHEELLPLVKEFGGVNVFVILMQRQGCNFNSDSRGYLSPLALKDWGCHVSGIHCAENAVKANCENILGLLKSEGFFNGT